jgi:hypothetical protein
MKKMTQSGSKKACTEEKSTHCFLEVEKNETSEKRENKISQNKIDETTVHSN